MSAALAVEGLTSGYGEAMVLRALSLAVQPGEVVAVLGKNGMGKSTLLKTVMGFLPARAGRIAILGRDSTGRKPHLLARRAVAYSPQDQAIFPDLTVAENLRLGLGRRGRLGAEIERVAEFFPFLAQRRGQRAGTLSGGEQKMLIMARSLMARPRLMLIDEITEGLQPSVITRLGEVLRRQRQEGTAILLVEQNVGFTLGLADRYAVLVRGEFIETGQAGPGAADRVAGHLAI